MTAQPSLFDAPAERGASRQTDPVTSRGAGRSMSGEVLKDQQALVLGAIATLARWGRTCTAWELWCYFETNFVTVSGEAPLRTPKENVISKRLGELRELGMVRETGETRPGSSHRHQMVFTLTDAGRSVA